MGVDNVIFCIWDSDFWRRGKICWDEQCLLNLSNVFGKVKNVNLHFQRKRHRPHLAWHNQCILLKLRGIVNIKSELFRTQTRKNAICCEWQSLSLDSQTGSVKPTDNFCVWLVMPMQQCKCAVLPDFYMIAAIESKSSLILKSKQLNLTFIMWHPTMQSQWHCLFSIQI